jgi:glycosyltransferase involved in cell wall biosynthesis
MKISIITPTLNHARFIEDTIQSVLNQDHKDVEHIVVDGGSTDGTIEILKKHPHLKWISEKDTGQSNAINKGFRMATGDIIAWCNSDDYYERNVFSEIAAFFRDHPDCCFLYGDITYIKEDKNVIFKFSGNDMSFASLLKNPDLVRQPSCFWRKELLQTIGFLNEDLHLVMDYDYILRIGRKHPFCYMPKNLSYFRFYAENKTTKMVKRQVRELRAVMKEYSAGIINFRFFAFVASRHFRSWTTAAKAAIRKILPG